MGDLVSSESGVDRGCDAACLLRSDVRDVTEDCVVTGKQDRHALARRQPEPHEATSDGVGSSFPLGEGHRASSNDVECDSVREVRGHSPERIGDQGHRLPGNQTNSTVQCRRRS